MNKNWIAFFSQTGTEIVNIINECKILPNFIITNKLSLEGINDELLEQLFSRLIILPHNPTEENYKGLIEHFENNDCSTDNTIITLHGYLRIVPPLLCDNYTVYNGHPGAIKLHPDLKGHNPQVRALKDRIIGCVIHKVTPIVDDGEIILEKNVVNNNLFEEEIIEHLKDVQLELWINFFKKQIKNNI